MILVLHGWKDPVCADGQRRGEGEDCVALASLSVLMLVNYKFVTVSAQGGPVGFDPTIQLCSQTLLLQSSALCCSSVVNVIPVICLWGTRIDTVSSFCYCIWSNIHHTLCRTSLSFLQWRRILLCPDLRLTDWPLVLCRLMGQLRAGIPLHVTQDTDPPQSHLEPNYP